MTQTTLDIKKYIRDVPDFPKKGIVFKDITPLLGDHRAFAAVLDTISKRYQAGEAVPPSPSNDSTGRDSLQSRCETGTNRRGGKVEKVLGIEARGFLFASAVAYRLGAGVVPARKKGKLPWKTHEASFALEYGTDTIEVHQDAISPGQNVLIVDDVLATGGTARAACELVEKLQGRIVEVAFLIELGFLKGREKLKGREIFSLIQY